MPRTRKEKKRVSGSRQQPQVEGPSLASTGDPCAGAALSEAFLPPARTLAPAQAFLGGSRPAVTAEETTPSIHPCPDPSALPDDWSLPGEFTPRSVATEAGWLELVQDTATGHALSALDLDYDAQPKGAGPPCLRKVRKDELYGDSAFIKVFVEKERKPLKERAEEKRQRKAEKREKRLLRYGGEP